MNIYRNLANQDILVSEDGCPLGWQTLGYDPNINEENKKYVLGFANGATIWDSSRMESEAVTVLKDTRKEAKDKVNLLCYTKIVSGFTSDALEEGEPYWYQSEPVDQANMQGIVTYALTIPAEDLGTTVDYRCRRVSDGADAFRPHTRAQILQVFSDGKDRLLSLLKRAKTLKEAIDLAPTPEQVAFIDLEDGW